MNEIRAHLASTVALVEKLVAAGPAPELEGLFLRAQRFVDEITEEARKEASTILEQAHQQASEITEDARLEASEIKWLFLRAQRFVDEEVEDTKRRVSQILAGADVRADQIVAHAKAQALELARRTAGQLSLPSEALTELEKSIYSFKRDTVDGGDELVTLNE